ncbi:MAG: epoxyqueuosine reductase QueH [Lachnospiraceae bacterium]|nr:epoxyqueuosine reductase QueH [Lachnospiraceae bacterium]
MNKRNYQRELEAIIGDPASKGKAVFLHSCCAPCSSYCMEYLCRVFRLTVFYYNPNIFPEEEYRLRAAEEKRLIEAYNAEIREGKREGFPIQIVEGEYQPERYFAIAKGYETVPEGGERCFRCFALRLSETAKAAKEAGMDYFSTTLTISPLKNAEKLNEIGEELGKEYGVPWLPCDFKKKNGYKRSIELSAQYGLYRQNFCGCVFSKNQRKADSLQAAGKEI